MRKKRVIVVAILYIIAFIFGLTIGKYFATNKAKAEDINNVEITIIDDKFQDNNQDKVRNKTDTEQNISHKKDQNETKNQGRDTKEVKVVSKEVELKNKEKINKYMGKSSKKVAYLTFDDGPSKDITLSVLEILKQNNIKATFFVVGSMIKPNQEILKKINDEGHAIGNHTYSHNYKNVYASPNAMLNEISDTEKLIKSIVGEGYNNRFFRFPGGSFNRPIDIKKAIEDNGYIYIDWNCLTGDAEGKMMSVEKQYERFLSTAKNKNSLVILMHDGIGKKTTPDVLIKVIDYLKENGYEFDVLR